MFKVSSEISSKLFSVNPYKNKNKVKYTQYTVAQSKHSYYEIHLVRSILCCEIDMFFEDQGQTVMVCI